MDTSWIPLHLINDTLCTTLQTPTYNKDPYPLNTPLYTNISLRARTHSVFTYLFTERVDESEKEENLDDMYDLMVR